jgi:hypothetical protein
LGSPRGQRLLPDPFNLQVHVNRHNWVLSGIKCSLKMLVTA